MITTPEELCERVERLEKTLSELIEWMALDLGAEGARLIQKNPPETTNSAEAESDVPQKGLRA